MASFSLRTELRTDDRAAIERLLREAAVFRPEEVAVALELFDEGFSSGAESHYRWVLADGPTLLGLACFGPVTLTEGTFDLYWIAVSPSAQRAGVGKVLDEAVCDLVRREGGRWVLAETSSTPPYEPARRFYLRCGYTPFERIPDFYRPGDDRLTFGKRLDGRA